MTANFSNAYSGGPSDPPTSFLVKITLRDQNNNVVNVANSGVSLNWNQQQQIAMTTSLPVSVLESAGVVYLYGTVQIGYIDGQGGFNLIEEDTSSLYWFGDD